MKRYLFIVAAAAIAAVSCSKTYDTNRKAGEGMPIALGTWSDVMTRAPRTGFAANDEFDVFGFKWNAGPADQTTVFNGDDVKYDGTAWIYTPIRFWDKNFANYTFFAAFPKDQLAAGVYAQNGLFVSNELTYDGENEVLLVAQKKDVANAAYGTQVPLVFKHAASLVDIKFKKHSNLTKAAVKVTSIAISGVQTKGKYTVASYDGSNNPVGKTVSGVDGLGWELAATPVVNASPAVAPYKNDSEVSLAADAGVGTSNAADLISNLVVMPQVLAKDAGPMITISYAITTGTSPNEETITYTDKTFYLGEFDKTDPDPDDKDNTDPRIASWMPGVHYTYYITINANTIDFTASVAEWNTTDATGHYYLIN